MSAFNNIGEAQWITAPNRLFYPFRLFIGKVIDVSGYQPGPSLVIG